MGDPPQTPPASPLTLPRHIRRLELDTSERRAYLLLLAVVLFWAGNFGLAWLLVGEAIHAYHLVGAVMVIAGVFLVTQPAG